MVYLYATDEQINHFQIGYMIHYSLHINSFFIEQVLKFLRATFHENKMENIRDVMRKKDTCIISLIMFYESKTKNPIKLYRVLSCFFYYIIDIQYKHNPL